MKAKEIPVTIGALPSKRSQPRYRDKAPVESFQKHKDRKVGSDVLYSVIDSKVIDYAEIIVVFFEHCNLKCVFCPQDHNSLVGASREEVLGKIPKLVEWIKLNKRSRYFRFNLMGGELFQDHFIEEGILDVYSEFMKIIREQVDPEKEVGFNFVTNLVMENTDAVIDFCERHDLKVSTSYDPSGRFSPKERAIFERNLDIFESHISVVSSILTAPNMKKIIAGDELYDKIYERHVCDWDYYLPGIEEVSEQLTPSESLLLEFLCLLVDKYPKCLNIEPFVNPQPQSKMRCTRGNNLTMLSDGTLPRGCSSSAIMRGGSSKSELEGTIILQNFFEQNKCFECEFFSQCPFTCFITNDYKKMVRNVEGCVFKETFKYVREKQNSSD